jgi:hypothetical protein
MERVRELARAKGEICSITDFYGGGLSNGRNDIGTLEREFGWSFKRTHETHGHEHHVHYALIKVGRTTRVPRQAVQQRLIAI